MDQQNLSKLTRGLITLKEKLKCPICLDVMQEAIELDCGHKYCKECYTEHKSTQKQVACPLCKKIIKRRSTIYEDGYANALGKFVKNSFQNIQQFYKCDVEHLQQKICTDTNPPTKVQADILKENETNNTITKKTRNLPSTSKTEEKTRKRPKSKENCEDAFDKLMHASAFNRNAKRRVYVNEKKLNKKTEYNILEFDNYENKTNVLRWLNDTRNLFDRLTQTQDFEEGHISPPIVDMESISQEKGNENNFKSAEITNIQKSRARSRAKSLNIEIKKPMPQNLNRYSDGGGSVIIENYNIEDVNTEEEEVVKKAEEKVLLDLIEDEFLNKLDNELQNHQYNNGQLKTTKISKKSGNQGNTPCSITSTTGWDRITKIKRTIKKGEKVPKQLNITLQSSSATRYDKEAENLKSIVKNNVAIPQQSNISKPNFDVSKRVLKVVLPNILIGESKITSESNLDIVLQTAGESKQIKNVENKLELVRQEKVEFMGLIDLNKVTSKTDESKILDSGRIDEQTILNEKPISYDFNKLEEYITRNIKIIDIPLKSQENLAFHSEETLDEDVVELDVDSKRTGTVEKYHISNLHDSKCTPTDQRKDQIVENDDVLFNLPTQKNPNDSGHTTSKEAIVIEDVKETITPSRPASSRITDKPNIVLQDNNAKLRQTNKSEVFTLRPDDIISDEETYVPVSEKSGKNHQDITVTSRHNTDSKGTTEMKVIFDNHDIDELYARPTQKIDHTCKDVTANFEVFLENACSVDDLLQLCEESLDKCLTSLIYGKIIYVETRLRNLQSLVAKFKLLNKEKNNELVAVATTDSNVAIQTFVKTADEKVQTENKCTTNTEVQTEDIHCLKCKNDLIHGNVGESAISQSTKTAMKSMVNESHVDFKLVDPNTTNISKKDASVSIPPSHSELFTATFDNLDFETQELAKNHGSILRNLEIKSDSLCNKQNNEEISSTDANKEAEENLLGSVLVCSVDTNPTYSKRVNNKVTNGDTSKRFKRIRMPTSDSDSEGEVKAKRKCNRFIRDDLSIEIHTNTEGAKGQNPALDSQDSDNINYDDYLAQVMKKYDDSNFSTNSSGKLSKVPSTSTKEVIDDMITKCEKMIEHANKNNQNIKQINNSSFASSRDSFQTASQSIDNNFDAALTADNMFMDERNLLKLEKDIRDYEKNNVKEANSEISDIIGATEELEPLPKRPKYSTVHRKNPQSESLFDPSDNLALKRRKSNDLDIFQELNDSLDAADLEIIEEQMNFNKANAPSKEKIKIIENIKIKSQDRKEGMNEEEDDLFSDEDIVEMTPQKKVDSFAERSMLSQIDNLAYLPSKDNLPTPLSNTENFEFDFEALPPPPGFQDDIQTLNNAADTPNPEPAVVDFDTMIDDLNKSSLTPDKLSQFNVDEKNKNDYMSQILTSCNIQYNSNGKEDQVQNNLSLTPDKLSQMDVNPATRTMINSTPVAKRNLAREALGISPIPVKKKQQSNLIEMAQTSKYTPLSSITKNNSQKQTILTSTPRQKSIWNYVKSSQSSEKEATTPVVKAKPCIACTRLTKDRIKSISQLTSKKLATYCSNFNLNVTHMIVAVNEDNRVRDYTIKFVSAVAAGIWVLRFSWIEECLKSNCIVPEEPHEVVDISGLPGPRTSRLTRNIDPLFKGYKFYCANPFISTTRQEVEEIIKLLKGKVLQDIKDLLEDDGNIGIIIGEGHGTQDFDQYERWVELYKTVTVDIEWLSKCVGQYKVISIRPYVWCSEDNLGDFGYPPYLTETVPLSFTETF